MRRQMEGNVQYLQKKVDSEHAGTVFFNGGLECFCKNECIIHSHAERTCGLHSEIASKIPSLKLRCISNPVNDPSHPGKVQALAGAETLLTGSPACFFALSEVYPDLQANANMSRLIIMASPAKIVRRRR